MDAAIRKSCCAGFYEKQELRLLLGDCWDPGGRDLTLELGSELQLESEDQVLDIASGLGSTGRLLMKNFHCNVVGVDLSSANLASAAKWTGDLSTRPSFCRSDAEYLPFRNAVFDATFSECSLCMFPSKEMAAREMFRVLSHEGRIAVSDMTLEGELSDELQRALSDFLCIAEAGPRSEYSRLFATAGFVEIRTYDKTQALLNLLENLRKAIFTAELLHGLKKISLSVDDVNRARTILKGVNSAARSGIIGYMALMATKP